ncbi:MAG: MG2 domain-containing protein, partial [Acidimicrobiia bacterium]|nr:MG2 domain-containing protein [Acidimicrobiia bacterium]
MRIRLSEGQAFPAALSEVAVVEGTVLSDDEVAAVLARLPELESDPDDQQDFNRPPDSLRPPLVGDTVETAFPPLPPAEDDRAEPTSGPLEVARFQPEGEVALAPFLSVTFNQPMVELTTLDQLREADIPVVVEPEVEGRWRWIGARTLRFELEPGPIDRLPAATEYTVTVPAGTRSASGAELAEAVTFSFATPAPQVTQVIGLSDATPVQPVLVAVFDQRVDPEAVLDSTTLTAGDDPVALELATTEQIDDDEQAARAVDAALEGRWVAFRPADPVPAATALELAIGPGTPSAEGPRTSTEASTHRGRTFDALTVTRQECNYGGPCQPGTPFTVEFNNPIDPERFDPASVTADPAIGGMRVGVSGSQMTITGATRGRTEYTITLPAELTDVFGQTLGRDTERTFEVGPAQTQLVPFNRPFVTVDPMADQPGIAVTSVNHDSVRVTAWRVDPDEVPAFQRYQESFYSDTDPADPDWPEVFDAEVDIDGGSDNNADTAVETLVDLTDAFAESSDGQLVVRVAPTREFDRDSEDYWYNRPTVAWVQSTTLGIDAILDGDEILVWTTDLVTGEVRPGVEVELVGSNRTVTTDDNGLARSPIQGRVRGLLGRDGTAEGRNAVGFLASGWYEGWEVQRNVDEARWYVFDDRGIYKPGETVRVTGWIRKLALSGDAQLELLGDGATVTWTAYDPVGNALGDGRVEVNPLGGFNLTVELPDSANLGYGFIELQATGAGIGQGGAYWSHQFQIQDFRTPEFEVSARPESPAPYYVVEPATVAVDAMYYAGGPLPDADVNWLVTSAQTTYRPPRWDQFNFGIWQPWWYGGGFGPIYEDAAFSRGFAEDVAFGEDIGCFGPDCPGGPKVEQFAGRTDGNGHHFLRMDFDGPDVDLPTTVTAEAQVTDVNRQVWASRTDLVVHPARYYVGLRADRPFVQQGTPIRVDTVVTDVDGGAVADAAVEVTAGRVDQVWANGEANGPWTEEVVDTQTCTVTSVALDPATANSPDADAARPEAMRCEFDTELGGQYRITAVVTDGDGRHNRSEMTVWVTGADAAPNRSVTQETVTMVPDADSYAPGDTAQLLVQAPFAPASGLVTVSRGGIVSTQTFDAPDGSAVIDIGIEEAWIPNVTVQVDMVGTAVRLADDGTPQPDVPPRPAFATGQLNLPIPPVTRALDVVAEAADPLLDPGAATSVTVTVNDVEGRPVAGADVAVIVVDEAVLSLTGYQLTDPLDVFYGDVWSQLFAEYTRSGIVLNRADLVTGDGEVIVGNGGDEATPTEDAGSDSAGFDQATSTTAAAELADGDDGAADRSGSGGPPIAVRTDF